MEEQTAKEQTTKEQQDSHLPAPYGVTEEMQDHLVELADSLPAIDPMIKLSERKVGFTIDDEEEVPEILNATINSITGYYGEWDNTSGDMELVKHPLDGPQPEDTEERGELLLTWRGEDFVLSLPPTGWRAFSKFYTKWLRRGFQLINSTAHIRSKLVRTKAGYQVNVPRFCLVQPGDPDAINAETIDDEIPF